MMSKEERLALEGRVKILRFYPSMKELYIVVGRMNEYVVNCFKLLISFFLLCEKHILRNKKKFCFFSFGIILFLLSIIKEEVTFGLG